MSLKLYKHIVHFTLLPKYFYDNTSPHTSQNEKKILKVIETTEVHFSSQVYIFFSKNRAVSEIIT